MYMRVSLKHHFLTRYAPHAIVDINFSSRVEPLCMDNKTLSEET